MSNISEEEFGIVTEADDTMPSPVILHIVRTLAVFIIIINSTLLLIVIRSKKLKSNDHFVLVLFLSASDTLVGVASVLLTMSVKNQVLYKVKFACSLIFVLFLITNGASLLLTLVICVERLIAVRFPHRLSSIFAGKRKYLFIMSTWVVSTTFFMTTVYLMIANKDFYWEQHHLCNARILLRKTYNSLIHYVTSFFGVVYLASIFFYFQTTLILLQQRRNNQQNLHNQNFRNNVLLPHATEDELLSDSKTNMQSADIRLDRHKKALVTVGLVIIAQTVSALPFILVFGLEVSGTISISRDIRTITCYFTILNSITNPILFAWKIEDFRKEAKEFLSCRLCCS